MTTQKISSQSQRKRSTKKSKSSAAEEVAERVVGLKLKKKELEEEIKELESQLLSDGKEKYVTDSGTLKLQTRHNYSVPNNITLLERSTLTQDSFIQSAKISGSVLKKMIGEKELNELTKDETIKVSESKYFKLIKED